MRPSALLLILALAGCGGAPDETRIGFVPKSLNQEYWVNTQKGAEAGAKAGGAKLLTHAAGDDTQIIEQMSSITGLRGPGKPAPKALAELAGRGMELVARMTGGEPEFTYKLTRDYYDTFMWASSAKAERDFGYKHRPARKTLARAIRWYLDRGYVDRKIAAEIRYDDLPGPDPAPSLPHERNAVYREG